MRIITGKFKGRALKTVNDTSVRPATDRVKGSIFNVLQNRLNLYGAHVLDLFAGSGSLGFEALSRGAARVTFVDDSDNAIEMIERNALLLGCLDACEFVQTDSLSFVDRAREGFDLIFADPPYAYDFIKEIPDKVFQRQLLKREGFLIIEHARRTTFETSPLYKIAVEKQFGNTRVSFFTHQSESGET